MNQIIIVVTQDSAAEQPEALHSVPVDDRYSNCAISGEPFERFWHEGSQTWHYRDAVALTGEQADRYGVAEGALVKFQCLGELDTSPSLTLSPTLSPTAAEDGTDIASALATTVETLQDDGDASGIWIALDLINNSVSEISCKECG